MGYMSELLGLPQKADSTPPTTQLMPSSVGMHPKLVKADFHGSIMTGMSHQANFGAPIPDLPINSTSEQEPMSGGFIWHRSSRNRKCFQDNHTQGPIQTYVIDQ